MLQLAWNRFGIIASIFGDMQARVIAMILYFTVILPFGLIMQGSSHAFKGDGNPSAASWDKREAVDSTLDGAKRQG